MGKDCTRRKPDIQFQDIYYKTIQNKRKYIISSLDVLSVREKKITYMREHHKCKMITSATPRNEHMR